MMQFVRRFARAILAALGRRAPAPLGDWARAMLGEADHIEHDDQAARWMIGAAVVLVRTLLAARLRAGLGVPVGFTGAFGVVIVSMTVHDVLANTMRTSLSMPLFFVVIPELVFATGIVLLWRRKRAAAVGVAVGAATLLTHATLHMLGR